MDPRTDDERLVTAQVAQFAVHELRAARDAPERAIAPETLRAFMDGATAMGLLDAEAGGLWSEDSGDADRQSILNLAAVAAECPDLALQLHQQALSARVLRADGGLDADASVTVDTRIPFLNLACGPVFPTEALVAWSSGDASPSDLSRLADWWLPAHADSALVVAPADWRRLLLPAMTEQGARWVLLDRGDVTGWRVSPLHAPDIWRAWQAEGVARAKRRVAAPLTPAGYLSTLRLAWLGQLAVGLGGLRRAARLAQEYAAQRRQGGVLIQEHAAVQALLAELNGAEQLCAALLTRVCEQDHHADWREVARARSTLHPLLWRALNAAMQVFGGVGYMKDTGVERLLRLHHTLGCLNGTASDMQRLSERARVAS